MESFNVRPQTHKRLKERVSIGRSRAKSAHFRGSPLFQATHNIKQQQTNKQLIQLILCQLDVGGWRKEKATRLTEVIKKRASIFKKKKSEHWQSTMFQIFCFLLMLVAYQIWIALHVTYSSKTGSCQSNLLISPIP